MLVLYIYTGRKTSSYIVFNQVRPIDHFTHVPVLVSQSSAESEYNVACTAVIELALFINAQ